MIHPDSVLLITLDSCRYDTFRRSRLLNLSQVAPLHCAKAPSYFTYGSHASMFMGFLPSIRDSVPWLNSKYAKLFRLASAGWVNREEEIFQLEGSTIVSGFKNKGYATIGSGAVGWFDPATETGAVLTSQFEEFYYPGAVWRLKQQLSWINERIQSLGSNPIFLFLNIGETHVPYWHEGASWDQNDNPCVPFQTKNRRKDCILRQKACLEYVDYHLPQLLKLFESATIIVTSDHGDCWGEDGLWEHGISHRRTLEVPIIMRVRGQPI